MLLLTWLGSTTIFSSWFPRSIACCCPSPRRRRSFDLNSSPFCTARHHGAMSVPWWISDSTATSSSISLSICHKRWTSCRLGSWVSLQTGWLSSYGCPALWVTYERIFFFISIISNRFTGISHGSIMNFLCFFHSQGDPCQCRAFFAFWASILIMWAHIFQLLWS